MEKKTKTGGRQVGSVNRITREVREKLADIIEAELPTIHEDLQELSPKDRLEILLRFIAYVVPRPEPIRIEEDSAQNLAIAYKGFS